MKVSNREKPKLIDNYISIPIYNKGSYLYSKIDIVDIKFSDEVWGFNNGYARSSNNSQYLHRLIMKPPKGMFVDHINLDKLDNRRNNLRICTHADNSRNKKAHNPKSGYKGVRRLKYENEYREFPFSARITFNYKEFHIGVYKTAEEAAIAYNNKAIELYGEYANLNIVEL